MRSRCRPVPVKPTVADLDVPIPKSGTDNTLAIRNRWQADIAVGPRRVTRISGGAAFDRNLLGGKFLFGRGLALACWSSRFLNSTATAAATAGLLAFGWSASVPGVNPSTGTNRSYAFLDSVAASGSRRFLVPTSLRSRGSLIATVCARFGSSDLWHAEQPPLKATSTYSSTSIGAERPSQL